jgi:hypothetical protein
LAISSGFRFNRHHPPPGLAFGEPDDRLQRMIQYAEALAIHCGLAAYWMPAFAGMTSVWCAHALHLLHPEQPLASQKGEQWQQRQTEDGEMIAFNPFEQMDAQPFKLIGPDT